MSSKDLRQAIEEALTHCAEHAESEDETNLIEWMAEHVRDAMDRGPRV